jgi:HD-GYP domain-containing protein (c-di-GMP phosphodiesterase class II)
VTVISAVRPRPAAPADVVVRVVESAREMLDMDAAYLTDTRQGGEHYVCVTGDAELVATGDARSMGVPVVLSGGDVFGTLCCVSHRPERWLRQRDRRFLHALARLVADHLEHDARERERERAELVSRTVGALLAALEARDGYTEEHSSAVVDLAVAAGRRLGLDGAVLEDLEHAARLHDIGKIGISDALLRKPGRLTPEEAAAMREHTVIGERIVASMPHLAHLAPVIRAGHERWDGLGYPDGLRARAIPVAARIVFVADAFHAMTSERPYRPAMSEGAAIAELERHAGSQFCASCVGAVVDAVTFA